MASGFSLADQLFNASSLGDLAAEHAAGVPGFDAQAFCDRVLPGLASRGLLERLDWIADCMEPFLAPDFPAMADQLEAAMPPLLDPTLRDGDFGRFIHAVPGILAVRHGLEHHRARALDLLHAATQRFSMEFYIRPFLNLWPDETLARLAVWAQDDNYHVRRLVSEGTRPRLPWARAVTLSADQTLPLLDALHGDRTRYVTRSVANHLNDLSKNDTDLVLDRLAAWRAEARQDGSELDWMARHALRTAVKAGHPRAVAALGFDPAAPVACSVTVNDPVRIGGVAQIVVTLRAVADTPVLVDYALHRPGADGGLRAKVFKLKQGIVQADVPLVLEKAHRLKADATTFRLLPGRYKIEVLVNGRVRDRAAFEVTEG